jgi:SAM-dependent methyltransferase
MADFDAFSETYGAAVQRSIDFCGQELEYFTRRKADLLLDLTGRHLGLPARATFLDVGCGVGETDELLAAHVGHLHGVDVAGDAISRAARRNPAAEYRTYDGDVLPYTDRSVDVAFAICVTHHVEPSGRPRFFAELNRVVRPGGLVAVFEHNPFNPLTRVAVSRCEFDDGVELLTRKSVARLLTEAGLVPIEARYIIFTTSTHPRAIAMERTLRHVPFGAQHYVVARRVV